MDPLGFALEHFDAVGRWRDRGESGAPIDASGTLPDGTRFDGVTGLRALLAGRSDQFVMALTEKLLGYAVGREVGYHDGPTVRTIVRAASRDDSRFAAIVLGIAKSPAFQMRRD